MTKGNTNSFKRTIAFGWKQVAMFVAALALAAPSLSAADVEYSFGPNGYLTCLEAVYVTITGEADVELAQTSFNVGLRYNNASSATSKPATAQQLPDGRYKISFDPYPTSYNTATTTKPLSVTIPAGVWTIDGVDSEEQVANYDLSYGTTISPKAADCVPKGSSYVHQLDGNMTLAINPTTLQSRLGDAVNNYRLLIMPGTVIKVYKGSDTEANRVMTAVVGEEGWMGEPGSFTLDLPPFVAGIDGDAVTPENPIVLPLTSATYYVLFPKYSLRFARNFEDVGFSITSDNRTWTLKSETPTLNVTPSTATIIQEISEFTVTVANISDVTMTGECSAITLKDANNVEYHPTSVTVDGTSYTFGLDTPITTKGNVSVSIPAGFWTCYGEPIAAKTATLKVWPAAPTAEDITILPDTYADGATIAEIPACHYLADPNATYETLKPGDPGTWFYQVANIADWPSLVLKTKVEASWTNDWVATANSTTVNADGKTKTNDGYFVSMMMNNTPISVPTDGVITLTISAYNSSTLLCTKTVTWTNAGPSATLDYSTFVFDPADGATLEGMNTVVKLTSPNPIATLEVYSPELKNKLSGDANNEFEVIHDQVNYTTEKANVDGTEWNINLNVPENYITLSGGNIDLAVKAYDANGFGDINSYLVRTIHYTVPIPETFYPLIVTPAEGNVNALDHFVFASDQAQMEGGVGIEWNNAEQAKVTGPDDYLYVFNSETDFSSSEAKGVTSIGDPIYWGILSIPAASRPTVPGEYTLYVPASYFILGEAISGHNEETSVVYNLSFAPVSFVNFRLVVNGALATNHRIAEDGSFTLQSADPLWQVASVEKVGLSQADIVGNDGVYTISNISPEAEISANLEYAGTLDNEVTGVGNITNEAFQVNVGTDGTNIIVSKMADGDNLAIYTVGGLTIYRAAVSGGLDQHKIAVTEGNVYIVIVERGGNSIAVKVTL